MAFMFRERLSRKGPKARLGCLGALLFVFGIGFATHALASEVSWTGDQNTDWSNDQNWSPKLEPSMGDSAVCDGLPSNAPQVKASVTVDSLRLSHCRLTVSAALSVIKTVSIWESGQLTLGSGSVDAGILTSAGLLDITKSGVFSITGLTLEKTSKLFTVAQGLDVGGKATLDGVLELDVSALAFTDAVLRVEVLRADEFVGGFSKVSVIGYDEDAYSWVPTIAVNDSGSTDRFLITFSRVLEVPEPSVLLLSLAALGLMAFSRGRRCSPK